MEKNDKPIRILQCVSNMDRAGIETMLMNFYRNIDRSKIQFDFLCNKSKPGDYDEEIRKLGGRIYVSPGLNPLKWFKYQKFMKNLFYEHPEYKIIHCQNETMGYPALVAAKKAGVPIRIAHSHNTTLDLDFKWPIKMLYRSQIKKYATDFVACSKAAGSFLFKSDDVKIINNAIDTKKFFYNDVIRKKIRKTLNIAEETIVIGHVGRFEQQKNHDFIIDIYVEYLKSNSNSVLLLIGEGSLKNKIIEKVRRLKITDNVIFTGNIPNVNEMYQAMDVFIMPSFHEGLPVVGVEAQIADLPCIFSTSITDEVKLNEKAFFISLEDKADVWRNKIADCEKLSKNRKSVLIDAYEISNIKDDLVNYYFGKYKCIPK